MASDDETVMTVAFPGRPEIALYRRGPVAPRVLLVSASAYPNSAGMLAALVLPAEGKQHVTLKHQKDQLVVYARKAHLNTKKNRHQHDDVPASSIPGGGPSGTSSPAQLRHVCHSHKQHHGVQRRAHYARGAHVPTSASMDHWQGPLGESRPTQVKAANNQQKHLLRPPTPPRVRVEKFENGFCRGGV